MVHDIRYETDEGIAAITIDRPKVHNAFRRQTILELNEALREATADDSVYVVVLTGAEGGFCAGTDITEMPNWREEMTEEEYAGYSGRSRTSFGSSDEWRNRRRSWEAHCC